jgi:hypothetical protein
MLVYGEGIKHFCRLPSKSLACLAVVKGKGSGYFVEFVAIHGYFVTRYITSKRRNFCYP